MYTIHNGAHVVLQVPENGVDFEVAIRDLERRIGCEVKINRVFLHARREAGDYYYVENPDGELVAVFQVDSRS